MLARPSCLPTKPSVESKAAVGEELRGTLHRGDFMQQLAGEENDLVLLRYDPVVTPFADVVLSFEARVVDSQFSTLELLRFPLEEVDESEVSRSHRIAVVIAVETEEVSVVACGDLDLNSGDGKLFHLEFLENLRQHGLDPLEHQILMLRKVHENAGAAVFVVDDATIRHGRYNLADAEVGDMFDRELCEFLKFLRSEEFVENNAVRRQMSWPL